MNFCAEKFFDTDVCVASNMSCDCMLGADGIHLHSFGVSQLKTVLNKKAFEFLKKEFILYRSMYLILLVLCSC